MKKIIFLFLLGCQALLAQKQDLYILYDDCSIHKILETTKDNITLEAYQIRFRDKIESEYKLTISDSGALIKKIDYISGKSYPHLSIIYLNENNENPPIKIKVEGITNKISVKTIIHAVDTDFSSLFKKFKNIYLVDFNDKTANIKIAKKVEIKMVSTL